MRMIIIHRFFFYIEAAISAYLVLMFHLHSRDPSHFLRLRPISSVLPRLQHFPRRESQAEEPKTRDHGCETCGKEISDRFALESINQLEVDGKFQLTPSSQLLEIQCSYLRLQEEQQPTSGITDEKWSGLHSFAKKPGRRNQTPCVLWLQHR